MSSTPTGLVWDTNMAAVSLFWDTNMAAVTSCENSLYFFVGTLYRFSAKNTLHHHCAEVCPATTFKAEKIFVGHLIISLQCSFCKLIVRRSQKKIARLKRSAKKVSSEW